MVRRFVSIACVLAIGGIPNAVPDLWPQATPDPDPSEAPLAAAFARFEEEQHGEREAALAAGYVYKSPSFWGEAPNGRLGGFLSGVERKSTSASSPYYRSVLNAYVRVRQERCPRAFGATPGRFVREDVRVRFDRYGNERDREVITSELILVERQLTPLWAYVNKVDGREKTIAQAAAEIANLFTDPRFVAEGALYRLQLDREVERDMEWLFRAVDCNSAVLMQFRENLYRIGMDIPTVQEAKVQIPGASRETDAPFATGQATNLFQACMEHQQRPYFDSDRRRTYCHCVSGNVSSLLNPDRLRVYSRAFWALGRDAFDQRVDPAVTTAMTRCMQ